MGRVGERKLYHYVRCLTQRRKFWLSIGSRLGKRLCTPRVNLDASRLTILVQSQPLWFDEIHLDFHTVLSHQLTTSSVALFGFPTGWMAPSGGHRITPQSARRLEMPHRAGVRRIYRVATWLPSVSYRDAAESLSSCCCQTVPQFRSRDDTKVSSGF